MSDANGFNGEDSSGRVSDVKKHARKRTSAQRAADLVFIERYHLRGKHHEFIATALSNERDYTISRQQVAYDLKCLEQLWHSEAKATLEVAKVRALKAFNIQEEAAWEAFDRSQNPTFLKVLLEIHDRRMALFGFRTNDPLPMEQRQPPKDPNFDEPLSREEEDRILTAHYTRTVTRQLAEKLHVSPYCLEQTFPLVGETRTDRNGSCAAGLAE
jgi:hypothetical protein